MNFDNASVVEEIVWAMKLADYPRGLNRAKINDLFNGVPPFTEQQRRTLNLGTNVNFLEGAELAHRARQQFYNALLKPGRFFTVRLNAGSRMRRADWGRIITEEINRVMKRSLRYMETLRSVIANVVLHGIGPSAWEGRQVWCPRALGVEDVLVPSKTLLDMSNLPYVAIFRQYTPHELYRITSGPHVDAGWQMDTVRDAIRWAMHQADALRGADWPEVWSPEKMAELIKENGGLYGSDSVPTIDCWDFWFWDDSGGEAGWRRRLVLDAAVAPGMGGGGPVAPAQSMIGSRGRFLYNSGDRVAAGHLSEVLHFQFGDLSAVAPFRYHSVRGLGFLIYSVCHLQNRLRSRFADSTFEAMLQYFRVATPEDEARALKVNLVDRAVIDSSVQFVPREQRWQPPVELIDRMLAMNQQLLGSHSSAWTQAFLQSDRREKTATEVMQQVSESSALVNAALLQAYAYQAHQYLEICRRFCQPVSADPDVRRVRAAMLRRGVPEKLLQVDAWDVEPEQVMGGGNKMLELAVANQLMAARPLYDPEAQREILRIYTLANSDDPDLSDRLVPVAPRPGPAVREAQLAAAVLFQGLPVEPPRGVAMPEYVETLVREMGLIAQTLARRGRAEIRELAGLQNMAMHVEQQLAVLEQDTAVRERVGVWRQALAGIGRLASQLAPAAPSLPAGVSQPNPADVARAQAILLQAQTKAEAARVSHAQRTAQRQVQWELEQRRRQEEHQQEMARETERATLAVLAE